MLKSRALPGFFMSNAYFCWFIVRNWVNSARLKNARVNFLSLFISSLLQIFD
jgi:hypothetical protein